MASLTTAGEWPGSIRETPQVAGLPPGQPFLHFMVVRFAKGFSVGFSEPPAIFESLRMASPHCKMLINPGLTPDH